jgi:hypothetical protein
LPCGIKCNAVLLHRMSLLVMLWTAPPPGT